MRRSNSCEFSTLGIVVASLVASVASANALPPVRAGILQCEGGQNVGFVVGSVTSLQCVFQSEGRRPEPYIATVHRFGVDLGFTDQTQFSWAVSAPNRRLGRGELAGNYGGVGANASVGVGFGGNFLVGGPQNAYAAPASQRAGPNRAERRGRNCRCRTGAGRAVSATGISPAPSSRLKTTTTVNERGPRKRVSFCVGLWRAANRRHARRN